MLAVVVTDVEGEGAYQFERRKFGAAPGEFLDDSNVGASGRLSEVTTSNDESFPRSSIFVDGSQRLPCNPNIPPPTCERTGVIVREASAVRLSSSPNAGRCFWLPGGLGRISCASLRFSNRADC